MADLQEALAARERRSRLTAVGISLVIILVIGFIIFRIANNDNSSVSDNGEGTETEQTVTDEDASSDTSGESVDLDELFGIEGENNPETNEGSSTEADTDSTTTEDEPRTVATTGADDDLPNTGPAETAAVGIVTIAAAYAFYRKNQLKLEEAQLK